MKYKGYTILIGGLCGNAIFRENNYLGTFNTIEDAKKVINMWVRTYGKAETI